MGVNLLRAEALVRIFLWKPRGFENQGFDLLWGKVKKNGPAKVGAAAPFSVLPRAPFEKDSTCRWVMRCQAIVQPKSPSR
jgi:hypothetical protein